MSTGGRGTQGGVRARRCNTCLVYSQIPTSGMRHIILTRELAAESFKLSFSLRITVIQRDFPHPRLLLFPRDSPHPGPGNTGIESQDRLCLLRTTQKAHPSSRTLDELRPLLQLHLGRTSLH